MASQRTGRSDIPARAPSLAPPDRVLPPPNTVGCVRAQNRIGAPFRNRVLSSKYADDEAGLLYYGYRFYAPALGRWVSRDPMEEKGGLGLYMMLNNSLLTKTDGLGLRGVRSVQLAISFVSDAMILINHAHKTGADLLLFDTVLHAEIRDYGGTAWLTTWLEVAVVGRVPRDVMAQLCRGSITCVSRPVMQPSMAIRFGIGFWKQMQWAG